MRTLHISLRIGRMDVAHRWETRECFPSALTFLRACATLKPATRGLFVEFFHRRPAWHDDKTPFSAASIAAFLRDLRGKTPIGVLAERTGYTRYQVGRWLAQKTEPNLAELLSLVEASSRRLLDFVACLVSPLALPSIADNWRELERAREIAYSTPFSHAVLRALELDSYRGLRGAAATRWLSVQLGVPEAEVTRLLSALAEAGQIRKRRGRWIPHHVLDVDTGREPERARALKAAWSQLALERLRTGSPGLFGYSVFAIARKDLARLRELQLEYVRAMQSVIAGSQPDECVALFCMQLLDLSAGPDNALA
jgi:DNA-binding transcriptional ArsR family regulator